MAIACRAHYLNYVPRRLARSIMHCVMVTRVFYLQCYVDLLVMFVGKVMRVVLATDVLV